MPPISSTLPKVKRGTPAGLPIPIVATNRPMRGEMNPFAGEPGETNTAQERPSSTSQKYSSDENLSAMSASAGATLIRTSEPKMPPMAEKTSAAPRASSARPLLVIRKVSST